MVGNSFGSSKKRTPEDINILKSLLSIWNDLNRTSKKDNADIRTSFFQLRVLSKQTETEQIDLE